MRRKGLDRGFRADGDTRGGRTGARVHGRTRAPNGQANRRTGKRVQGGEQTDERTEADSRIAG